VSDLERAILKGRNSLSAERLDMSFGELINMYSNDELIIDPEFQRLFRWDIDKRTVFIESLLLGIPIPSIFVAEDSEGKWEIVDGLQRLSTVLSFFGLLKNDIQNANNWTLEEGDIIAELKGLKSQDLPIKFQLNLKRSVCRIEVVKWDSDYDMRYELFKRLNTGGEPLADQEIRNCIFRGISPVFTDLIKQLASDVDFINFIAPTDKQASELYLDELVLRFFSLYNNHNEIKKNLSEHMTDYMRDATSNADLYQGKIEVFTRTFQVAKKLGRAAVNGLNGQLSTSLYDGLFHGIATNLDHYEAMDVDRLREKMERLKADDEFKKASGVASNYKERTRKRIERAINIFAEA